MKYVIGDDIFTLESHNKSNKVLKPDVENALSLIKVLMQSNGIKEVKL